MRPQRGETLEFLAVLRSLDALAEAVELKESRRPLCAVTTSRRTWQAIIYDHAIREVKGAETPIVILFGTGWGLAEEVFKMSDMILTPVWAETDMGFNHLSV